MLLGSPDPTSAGCAENRDVVGDCEATHVVDQAESGVGQLHVVCATGHVDR